jgi:hypothetical protein
MRVSIVSLLRCDEHVSALGAAGVAAFHQHRIRTHRDELLGLAQH